MTYEYSLWSETTGGETRWFWIIDEVNENEEKVIASGIENTHKAAIKKIKKYCPDIEEE